jgi:hypothetical protein
VIGTHVNDVGESIPRHPRHRVLPPDGDFVQALLIRVGDVVRARKDVGPFGLQLSRHPCPRSGLGNRPSVRLTQRPVLLLQRAVSPATNHRERFFTQRTKFDQKKNDSNSFITPQNYIRISVIAQKKQIRWKLLMAIYSGFYILQNLPVCFYHEIV